jgi:DNA-binding transcriptional ArsR family regulator
VILAAGWSLAQVIGPGPLPAPAPARFVPDALRLFLGLTDAQVRIISAKNSEFGRFHAEKTRRQAQVRREIAEETRKEILDPLALGVRYMEIELIAREIRAAERRLAEELRKELTAEQIAKLEALEKAMELVPLYQQAAGVRLIIPPVQNPIRAVLVPAAPETEDQAH